MQYYDFYLSPIGCLYLEASEKGLSSIRLIDDSEIHTSRPNEVTTATIGQLKEYFDGKLMEFSIPLDLKKGTEFQQQVWKYVSDIPYARTVSYMDIAEYLQNKGAVRAVGAANGSNPVPIVIPCHRVIGSNGQLTGYALGMEIKQFLLRHENPQVFATQTSLFD